MLLKIFIVYNNKDDWEGIKEKIDNKTKDRIYVNIIIGGILI